MKNNNLPLSLQVTTLEQSRRLKELGCERDFESLFVWQRFLGDKWRIEENKWNENLSVYETDNTLYAYNVAELGEMLDWLVGAIQCSIDDLEYRWTVFVNDAIYSCHKTEAEARGALLIYILEKERIKNE